jgi:hypothetical protein
MSSINKRFGARLTRSLHLRMPEKLQKRVDVGSFPNESLF